MIVINSSFCEKESKVKNIRIEKQIDLISLIFINVSECFCQLANIGLRIYYVWSFETAVLSSVRKVGNKQ
jgi:hypothetical protein